MSKDLKKFAALFVDRAGPEWRIIVIEFRIESERDAMLIAEDLALLEGRELIYLSRWQKGKGR